MNLKQFVKKAVSKDLQSNVKGGIDIRPYLNDNYEIEIFGHGPYTTYLDGINMGGD